jgi:hypothetical protein
MGRIYRIRRIKEIGIISRRSPVKAISLYLEEQFTKRL